MDGEREREIYIKRERRGNDGDEKTKAISSSTSTLIVLYIRIEFTQSAMNYTMYRIQCSTHTLICSYFTIEKLVLLHSNDVV